MQRETGGDIFVLFLNKSAKINFQLIIAVLLFQFSCLIFENFMRNYVGVFFLECLSFI